MAVRMAASERDWWMQGRSRAPLLSSIQRLVLALEWKSNSYSIREWSFCRPRIALSQSAMLWRASYWALASRLR
jgi:hypothetical protein